MFSIVPAKAESSSDDYTQTNEYVRAKVLLNKIGVLSMYSNTDVDALSQNFVRRDIFAYMTAKLMNLSVAEYNGSRKLIDLKKGDFAYDEIHALLDMGIVELTANEFYSPSSYITYADAEKTLVKVLGYGIMAELGNMSYSVIANKLKLFNGIERYKDNRIQLKYVIRLLYNALECNVFQEVAYNEKGAIDYKTVDGETLLYTKFDIYKTEGIITSNEFSALDNMPIAKEGCITIEGKAYYTGDTAVHDYLGYYAEAYALDKGEDIHELVYVDIESCNKMVTFDAEDGEYLPYTYTYYEQNAAKKKNIRLEKNFVLIVNGVCTDVSNEKMIPAQGIITVVRPGNSSGYSLVSITSYQTLVVNSVSTSNEQISFKNGILPIDLSKYDEKHIKITNSKGKVVKYTTLKEWDVLTVHKCGDTFEAYLTREEIKGTVTSVSEHNGKTIIGVDDETYELSSAIHNNFSSIIKLSSYGSFYLDYFGKVVAFVNNSSGWNYGYLIEYDYTDGLDSEHIFRIYTDGGEFKIFNAANRLKVDSKIYKKDGTATTGNSKLTDLLSEGQLIRYKVNNDNLLTYIDSSEVAEDVDTLKKYYENDNIKYYNGTFVGKATLDSATRVFVIPDDIKDEEQYYLTQKSYLQNDKPYAIKAYKSAESKLSADVLVIKPNDIIPTATKAGMISEISTVLNEDGEVVNNITLVLDGKVVNYLSDKEGFVAEKDIEVGDFVRLSLRNNVIKDVEVFYDLSKDALNSEFAGRSVDHSCFIYKGYLYDKEQQMIQISASEDELTNDIVLDTQRANIICYDSSARANKVSVYSIEEIRDYIGFGIADKIVIQSSYSLPVVIAVYK